MGRDLCLFPWAWQSWLVNRTLLTTRISSPVSSRRLLKAAEAIREVVATSILTDLRDPRVRDVTVLSVEVSPDMREAKVSVSVMGAEAQQQLSVRGLQNAAGFLQSRIADRIETRYTPKLRFVLDQGTKNVAAVGEILERIRQEQAGETSELDDDVPPQDDSGEDDPTINKTS